MILKPTAVDIIIQSSTVELFQQYEISVAPRGRTEVSGHAPDCEVVGIIGFDGPGIGGVLTIAVPSTIFALPTPRRSKSTTHAEWTRELTNQLLGSIKNRLLQFQVKLRTHVPSVLSGAAIERHQQRGAREVLYLFGALRGAVSVTVDASLTRAVLEYSNAPLLIGDAELFLFD